MHNSPIKITSDIQHSYLVTMVLISDMINKSVTNTSILTSTFLFLMVLSSSPQCVYPFPIVTLLFFKLLAHSLSQIKHLSHFPIFFGLESSCSTGLICLSITTLMACDWHTGTSSIFSWLASCVLSFCNEDVLSSFKSLVSCGCHSLTKVLSVLPNFCCCLMSLK